MIICGQLDQLWMYSTLPTTMKCIKPAQDVLQETAEPTVLDNLEVPFWPDSVTVPVPGFRRRSVGLGVVDAAPPAAELC